LSAPHNSFSNRFHIIVQYKKCVHERFLQTQNNGVVIFRENWNDFRSERNAQRFIPNKYDMRAEFLKRACNIFGRRKTELQPFENVLRALNFARTGRNRPRPPEGEKSENSVFLVAGLSFANGKRACRQKFVKKHKKKKTVPRHSSYETAANRVHIYVYNYINASKRSTHLIISFK